MWAAIIIRLAGALPLPVPRFRAMRLPKASTRLSSTSPAISWTISRRTASSCPHGP